MKFTAFAVLVFLLIQRSWTFSLFNPQHLDVAIDQLEEHRANLDERNTEDEASVVNGELKMLETRGSTIEETARRLQELTDKIARAILEAEKQLQPAKTAKQIAGKGN